MNDDTQGSMSATDLDGLRDQLVAVLCSIEAGAMPAEVDQVAYLRGALATVEILAGSLSQLHTFETGDDR